MSKCWLSECRWLMDRREKDDFPRVCDLMLTGAIPLVSTDAFSSSLSWSYSLMFHLMPCNSHVKLWTLRLH